MHKLSPFHILAQISALLLSHYYCFVDVIAFFVEFGKHLRDVRRLHAVSHGSAQKLFH